MPIITNLYFQKAKVWLYSVDCVVGINNSEGDWRKWRVMRWRDLICPNNIPLIKHRWTLNRVALTDQRKSLASLRFYLSNLRISPFSVPKHSLLQSLQKTTRVLEQLAIVKTVTLKKAKSRKEKMLRCADTVLTWYSIQSIISGVQSNFPYTGRSSSQGRIEIDQKEG